MKKKSLIILSSLILLTACSNGNKNTTDKNFSSKDKIAKTSKSSSSVEKSSSSSSESASSSDKSSAQTSSTESSTQTGTTPSSADPVVAQPALTNQPYPSELWPSVQNPEMMKQYRDGFYVSPAWVSPNEVIAQYTNGNETEQVLVDGDDSRAFLSWIRQVAPTGHTDNGLVSNYNYWVENVRE